MFSLFFLRLFFIPLSQGPGISDPTDEYKRTAQEEAGWLFTAIIIIIFNNNNNNNSEEASYYCARSRQLFSSFYH